MNCHNGTQPGDVLTNSMIKGLNTDIHCLRLKCILLLNWQLLTEKLLLSSEQYYFKNVNYLIKIKMTRGPFKLP